MRPVKSATMAAAAFAIAAAVPTDPAAQVEQSSREGQMKSMQCIACHGPSGISPNPTFPHLAGQNATYLAVQLENFKSGERYHPLMTPVAQSLSDEDIADLASFFSSIGPLAAASGGAQP